MISYFEKRHNSLLYRILSAFITLTFVFTSVLPPGYAQTISTLNLPVPGAMVTPSAAFVPVLLKGMTIHPENPLQFDFIVDSGNTKFSEDQIKQESERLMKVLDKARAMSDKDFELNGPDLAKEFISESKKNLESFDSLLTQTLIVKAFRTLNEVFVWKKRLHARPLFDVQPNQ